MEQGRKPKINDRVTLLRGIPELELSKGQTGVVKSTWFEPVTAYEVEFSNITRALLFPDQIELAQV